MGIDVRACSSLEELRDAQNAISHYFGHENHLEDAGHVLALEELVGGAAALRRSRAASGGPKNRALLELDGKPAGYAIDHVKQDWASGSSIGVVDIVEVVTPTPEAARELWRWLLDFDWTSEFQANLLPLDHELFMLVAEPRRLKFTINDGVWVRLLDIGQALSARTYNAGEIVLDVEDAFLPENAGRWRGTPGGAERTDATPELRLDVTGLGSVYLGGFTFGELVRGSRAHELTAGAGDRADALFHTTVEPWCPEIF